jgi:hypothetical protein
MGSNTTIIVTGAALLAASLGLGYMTYSVASEKLPKDKIKNERALATVTEIDDDVVDDEGSDIITEHDVVKIFGKLFLEVQLAFTQLMNQVQQLQMTGQGIPEAQLQAILRQELERALMAKQGAIIEGAGIDADCLEEAVWEFLDQGSQKVKIAVERLQKLWQTATGEPVVGWRPGKETVPEKLLSGAETIEAAEVYFDALTNCMRKLIADYKESGKDLNVLAVQRELNLDFSTAVSETGEAALEKQLGISQSQFEASVASHKNNPDVARALTMLQMRQQQAFATMQAAN